MINLEYSLTSDFSNGIKMNQFHTEIKNDSGITTTFYGVSRSGNKIIIHFDQQPSASEITTLNNIIASHVPDYTVYKNVKWILQDKKEVGTNGGTFTKDIWQKRDLNTLQINDGPNVTLNTGTSEFTCVKGRYNIQATSLTNNVGDNRLRLYNSTDASVVSVGINSYSGNGTNLNISNTSTKLETIIDINDTKTFELQHICSITKTNDGFGISSAQGDEIYTELIITSID